ncbi:hypothetical protein GALMADRAFT_212873 [Galerina marginata CBS 339.88]|uniref:Uncharacterized protein n=1 Tax=Galerina marginata (strain CBS 339.88) TaxID=685588 RepID=A0A067T1F5_GALM3|nr:hypothetical protein GALMADRAFT_212873 [Galerina marginata CBS 339.88]
MPSFSVKGIFGGNASLTTSTPGKLNISSLTRGFRARSEPLPPTNDNDVEMASPERIPRSRSEYATRTLESNFTPVSKCDTRDTVEPVEEEGPLEACEGVTAPARAPSPAATEIHDPDSQDIIIGLTMKGIKVRDFAFNKPTITNVPPPVTEVFDQYRALTEIDYRWSQPERNHPVQGKTLRRLLDMGWLTQADLLARGAPMDFEELEKFDSRPHYPWRPFRRSTMPSLAERRDMLTARRGYWVQVDKMKAHMNRELERRREEERRMALVAAHLEEMERGVQSSEGKGKGREGPASNGSKRRYDENEGEDEMNTGNDSEVDPLPENPSAPKKRRITPEPSSQYSQAQSQSQDPYYNMVPPTKQYPAPLHTYNPELYPDAASIIESSSQSQSQPRPVVPERSDTPPLTTEEEESQGWSPGKGTRLVHPRHQKALKRALSRTQTFAQL